MLPCLMERPQVTAQSFKVPLCEYTFASAADYNAHFKFVHGVESGAKELTIKPTAQTMDGLAATQANDNHAFQEATLTAMKNLTMTSSQYLPLNRLNMRPSKKELEEGWEELRVNIEEYGLFKPGETTIMVKHYSMVKARVLELVNKNEHEKLKAAYHRKSGKELTCSHRINLKHLEDAVKELVNKNAAECNQGTAGDKIISQNWIVIANG